MMVAIALANSAFAILATIPSRCTNPHAATLLGGLVQLADTLDLALVTAGIERPDQVSEVIALNARLGQGFKLSRPLPAGDLEALLHDHQAARSGAMTAGSSVVS